MGKRGMKAGRRDRTAGQAGITLIELVVVIGVLLVLAGVAIPSARFVIKRQKELELRRGLRDLRTAIDLYHTYCVAGSIPKEGVDSECYPPELEILVEGVDKVGTVGQKIKFLRRIPIDPFTKSEEWGKRSLQDDADSSSWGRQNVYDVYTEYEGTALDGTEYKDW
jgi:general secretion pathway protein G